MLATVITELASSLFTLLKLEICDVPVQCSVYV